MVRVCLALGTAWVASIVMMRAELAGGNGLAGYMTKLHSDGDDDDDDVDDDDDDAVDEDL